ncbi:MAG: hypothetical protein QM817_29870 [Archangium sp.]
MNTYSLVVALHVIVAVLGLAPIVHVAFTGDRSRALVLTRASFGLLLVTGIVADVMVSGAWHQTVWFRASGALVLVSAGVMMAMGRAKTPELAKTLARVECLIIAVIVSLMELKP